MKVGVGADHAGVSLKTEIAEHLRRGGHDVTNYGVDSDDPVDYPVVVRPLAEAVASGKVERGVFCCGSGIGPAVVANKIAGVRAAVVSDEWSARDGVQHVDMNLLTLGERVIGVELAKSIVDAYLGATPDGGRHARRREQIASLERKELVKS